VGFYSLRAISAMFLGAVLNHHRVQSRYCFPDWPLHLFPDPSLRHYPFLPQCPEQVLYHCWSWA